MNRIRLSPLVVSFGVAVIMALLLSGFAGASGGTSIPQPQSSSVSPQQEVQPGNSIALAQSPLCRYGVTASGATQYNWLPTWRAGWWMDYGAHPNPPGVAAEFAQVVFIKQMKNGCTYLDGYTTSSALTDDSLGAVVRAAPGSLWLIGNEIERGPDPGKCTVNQGDIYPEVYARAYHDIYTFIKQRDPTAQVANGALVEITPGRLQYLDKVWQAYQQRYGQTMPVDVWNMHVYVLPEAQPNGTPNGVASVALGTDPALAIRESGGDKSRCSDLNVYCWAEADDVQGAFAQQVVAMRTWMKEHGQQNKPFIISEYSILYPYEIDPEGCYLKDEYGNCFTPQRVSAFLSNTFNYLESAKDPALGYPLDENRLVQRWMWFMAYSSAVGKVSNLLEPSLTSLTLVGDQFKTEAAARPSGINLFAGQVGGVAGFVRVPGGAATASLYAQTLIGGSTPVGTPFTVTFYKDQALTQVIGSAVVSQAVGRCVSGPFTVGATWANLPVGVHPFWVKIDSANNVSEVNEGDNIVKGTVLVPAVGEFLPLLSRQ